MRGAHQCAVAVAALAVALAVVVAGVVVVAVVGATQSDHITTSSARSRWPATWGERGWRTTVIGVDITTVADDLIVLHDGITVARYQHLQPATSYDLLGLTVTTLGRPAGELLCRVATVNDVHFGEQEAAASTTHAEGPIQRVQPGETPYPDTMSRSAVREIAAIEPAAVVVKGDLTADGTDDEWAAFEACYRQPFGPRLHVVRGNHDAYRGQHAYAGDQWIELPGVAIALLDTVIPARHHRHADTGATGLAGCHAATSDRPVLVMGHHQQWVAGSENSHRGEGYFGLHPDASDGLNTVAARRRAIVAYTAGHTHRHRVRHMACGVPTIEVGCVKDFPGHLGRVPRVRRRHHAGGTPGVDRRCTWLERTLPLPVPRLRNRLRVVRGWPRWRTDAATSRCGESRVRRGRRHAAAHHACDHARPVGSPWCARRVEHPRVGCPCPAHVRHHRRLPHRPQPSVDRVLADAAEYYATVLADPTAHQGVASRPARPPAS